MLIALLLVLGADLIVVVAFAAFVFGRRRWLKRQPGAFAGAIRVSDGDVDGLSPKWKRWCLCSGEVSPAPRRRRSSYHPCRAMRPPS
jgi:hypothetical protein